MQAEIPESPNVSRRRLWTLERPSGDVFSCDVERSKPGWMVWFSVNDQAVGGHRFDTLPAATEWADILRNEWPAPPEPVSYARG